MPHNPVALTLRFAHALQVALHLSVPYLIAPLRVRFALKFNLNAADVVLDSADLYRGGGAAINASREPEAARRELVRHGVCFGLCLGGSAASMGHAVLAGSGGD